MRRRVRLLVALAVATGLAWLASRLPPALSKMELFRVDRVAVEGVRHLDSAVVAAALELSPEASIWDEPSEWRRRVGLLTLVERVRISRRLPSTLVVHVEEREPVALLATPTLVPVDVDGRVLPIDPAVHRLNLPIVRPPSELELPEPSSGDDDAVGAPPGPVPIRRLTREVGRLSETDPEFASLLSELYWDGAGDVIAHWGEPDLVVRFRPPLAGRRLRRARAVIDDAWARWPGRGLRSVDLRYEGQIVAGLGEGTTP